MFKEIIEKELKKAGVKSPVLEIPKDEKLGDYAFPCFQLSKEKKKNPADIARDLADKIKLGKEIQEVKVIGPYLNFFTNKNLLAQEILTQILKEKEEYGKRKDKGKLLIEFCHANTHKAFHIGHTRNICIGESVSRILEFSGKKIIRANYQGDIGMHVAKTLWGLLHLKELGLVAPEKEKGRWLGMVYAAASQAAQDENIAEEINTINQKIYAGDKNLLELWKKTRKWSIDYFEKIVYPDFNAKFDRFYFESEVEKKGIEAVNSLLKKGIAKLNEGAIIMDFEKEGLGVFILLKSDKTPLYSTKDIALAEIQEKEFHPDKILHIVGSEQNLYFKQLIKTFSAYNKKLAEKEQHISYELVILPSGKMASREGKVILYDDTLAEIIELVKVEIKKRNKKISKIELEKRAKTIALAAIKYAMLSQDIRKTIIFNEGEITRFEGNTGPYLQYTYARASSIMRKSGKKPDFKKAHIVSLNEKEVSLVNKLSRFPDIVKHSAETYNPALIANYAYELSQIFNEFYHNSQVLGSLEEDFRLILTQATRFVLKNSLSLLGIAVLEEM